MDPKNNQMIPKMSQIPPKPFHLNLKHLHQLEEIEL
jgi:hypothetical protein